MPLRLGRRVLGQELELVVLVFKVTDVAVAARISWAAQVQKGGQGQQTHPYASQVQAVGAVIYRNKSECSSSRPPRSRHTPEGHAHARDGIQHGEAANGVLAAGLPEAVLAVAHAREARRLAMLCSPIHGTAVLGALVAGVLVKLKAAPGARPRRAALSRRRVVTIRPPSALRQALHDVGVPQRRVRLADAHVPQRW